MTREEVHDLMENELRCVQRGGYCDRDCAKCPLVKDDKELIEAYGYVIKMLEQGSCDDCISRQEMLETQAKYAEYIGATKFWQMRDDIKGLPPVIPQHTGAEIQKMQELEKELNTWNLDDARKDFISDVYNTLDFLPTNEEANRIIDSFDRITSNIEPQPKTGHWIRVTDKTGHLVWECDRCDWQQRFNTNFCPDCGAKMMEPQESEEK